MFGTFRYDFSTKKSLPKSRRKNVDVQFQPAQATAGSFPPHAACDTCRAKKLRCNGHKPACNRCQAIGSHCKYTQTTESRKRKASTQRTELTDPSGRAQLPSERTPSDQGDQHAELSESPAGSLGDTALDVWHQDPRDEPRLDNHISVDLVHVNPEESDHQCGPAQELVVPELVGTTTDFARGGIYQQGVMDPVWDPLGTHDLDLMGWENIISPSPGSTVTQTQDFGNCHIPDQQRKVVAQALPTPSSFDPPVSSTPRKYSSGETTTATSSKKSSVSSCVSGNDAKSIHCTCLQSSVALLDEIHNRVFRGPSSVPFDFGLRFLKGTLEKCSAAFRCAHSGSRPEICMLLAVIMERLITLSEDVAVEYALVTDMITSDENATARQMKKGGLGTTSQRLGSYDLDSLEYSLIVRSLLVLHVKSCRALILEMTHVARHSNREAHVHLLATIEHQIDDLLALLGEKS